MRWARFPLFAALIAIWAISETGFAHAQTEALEREIRLRVERLIESGELWIRKSPIAAAQLIA